MTAVDRKLQSRGVLEGGFHLLDVLSRFDAGAGLSQLAREAQLPKATTHRLLEQLVALGAVERHGPRYLVGPLMRRLGSSWQPAPTLAFAAEDPLRTLSALTSTITSVSVMRGGRPTVVTAIRGAVTDVPLPRPADVYADSTAAARVHRLLDNPPDGEPPAGFSPHAWRAAHRAFENAGAILVEHAEVVPGISCLAMPVRGVHGEPVAVICALAVRPSVPAGVAELVERAAREITRNLARPAHPAMAAARRRSPQR